MSSRVEYNLQQAKINIDNYIRNKKDPKQSKLDDYFEIRLPSDRSFSSTFEYKEALCVPIIHKSDIIVKNEHYNNHDRSTYIDSHYLSESDIPENISLISSNLIKPVILSINDNYEVDKEFVPTSRQTVSKTLANSPKAMHRIMYREISDVYDENQDNHMVKLPLPHIMDILVNPINRSYSSTIIKEMSITSCRINETCRAYNKNSYRSPKKLKGEKLNLMFQGIMHKLNYYLSIVANIKLSKDSVTVNTKIAMICIELNIDESDIGEIIEIESPIRTITDGLDPKYFLHLLNIAKDYILHHKCMCNICDKYDGFITRAYPLFFALDSIFKPKNVIDFHNRFVRGMTTDLLSSLVSFSLDSIKKDRPEDYFLPSEETLIKSYCAHLMLTTLLDLETIELRCLQLTLSLNNSCIQKKHIDKPKNTIICSMIMHGYEITFPEYPKEIFEYLNIKYENPTESSKELNPSSFIINPVKECQVCYDEQSITDNILSCAHSICSNCFIQYMKSELENNIVSIKCPVCKALPKSSAEDNISTIPEHILKSIVDDDTISTFQKKSLDIATLSPNFRTCATPNCSYAIEILDTLSLYWVCPTCSGRNCTRCKKSHEYIYDRPCPKDILEDQTTCPWCSTNVNKIDGCNHITCHCGNHFCYKCGSKYKTAQGKPIATCDCPLYGD